MSDCLLTGAVHYVGTLREGGEAFMDTRAESESHEPVQVVAGRGEAGGSGGLAGLAERLASGTARVCQRRALLHYHTHWQRSRSPHIQAADVYSVYFAPAA